MIIFCIFAIIQGQQFCCQQQKEVYSYLTNTHSKQLESELKKKKDAWLNSNI